MKNIDFYERIFVWIPCMILNAFILNAVIFTLINFALYSINEINPKLLWYLWYPLTTFIQIYIITLTIVISYLTYIVYVKPYRKGE